MIIFHASSLFDIILIIILTINISNFDRYAYLRQTAIKLQVIRKRVEFSFPCDAEHLTAEFPEALGRLIIHGSLGAFSRCTVTARRAEDR